MWLKRRGRYGFVTQCVLQLPQVFSLAALYCLLCCAVGCCTMLPACGWCLCRLSTEGFCMTRLSSLRSSSSSLNKPLAGSSRCKRMVCQVVLAAAVRLQVCAHVQPQGCLTGTAAAGDGGPESVGSSGSSSSLHKGVQPACHWSCEVNAKGQERAADYWCLTASLAGWWCNIGLCLEFWDDEMQRL